MNSASSFVNAYKIAGHLPGSHCMRPIACNKYRNGFCVERARAGRKQP